MKTFIERLCCVFLVLFLAGCFPDYIPEEELIFHENLVNELNSLPIRKSLGFPSLNGVGVSYDWSDITYGERIKKEGFKCEIISVINSDGAAFENRKNPSYWENEKTLYLVQFDAIPEFFSLRYPIWGLRILYGLESASPKYHKVCYGPNDIPRFYPRKINSTNTTTQEDFVEITQEEALRIKEILLNGNIEELKVLYDKEYMMSFGG